MTRKGVRDRLRGRAAGSSGEAGSIALALLLTLIGTMLAALLIPMLLTENTATRADVHREHALQAAQSGLDLALGLIRSAYDPTLANYTGDQPAGLLAPLPCGPLTGSIDVSSFAVTIGYYSRDPQQLSAPDVVCHAVAPSYARITSTGTDGTAVRTLKATYTFSLSGANIAGGLVHVYKTVGSNDLCLDAGSGSPVAGTPVTMEMCSAGSIEQTFAYTDKLNLVLVGSRTTLTLGMCLDAGSVHAAGSEVEFQPCGTTTQPAQQWSFNAAANLMGTTDGSTTDGYCFNVNTPDTPGSTVVLSKTECNKGYDIIETFSPEASVGAGAAGAPTGQLVNFDQFGRCLDVTEQNVTYGGNASIGAKLIDWPCKQSPNPSNVDWNQKWTWPVAVGSADHADGPVSVTTGGVTYCLQTPGSTAAGLYVRLLPCPSPIPLDMVWSVYTATTDYETGYRIADQYKDVDGNPDCLSVTDPGAPVPDLYPKGNQISWIIVETCSGSTLQKWNAPPSISQGVPLKDIGEN